MVWPPQSLLVMLAKMNFCSKAIQLPMDWSEPEDTLKEEGSEGGSGAATGGVEQGAKGTGEG